VALQGTFEGGGESARNYLKQGIFNLTIPAILWLFFFCLIDGEGVYADECQDIKEVAFIRVSSLKDGLFRPIYYP
jgi:hypothetical protein